MNPYTVYTNEKKSLTAIFFSLFRIPYPKDILL